MKCKGANAAKPRAKVEASKQSLNLYLVLNT
jgi:hypothetical protein